MNSPFNLPNLNQLKPTQNSFLAQNMNNLNNKNPFSLAINNTEANNLNLNSKTKDNTFNPFLGAQSQFTNTNFFNQKPSLNIKPAEKDDNLLIKISDSTNMIQNNPLDSKDKNILSINSSDSSNQFFINNKTLASPNFPMLNNGKIQPNLNFSSTSDNLSKERNVSQFPKNMNNNPFLNNNPFINNKNEKEKEKEENKNILINNNIKENNKFPQFEFNTSPKKQLEIIKEEDEDLKLKKNEPSSKEIFSENIFNKNENDSEKEKGKEKENNKNIGNQILEIKNNFTNGNENEQKQEKNSEKDLSNIKEENNENELFEENNPINKAENKNNINNENEINLENKNENNLNNNNNNVIKLEDVLNISSDEEEIKKLIEENNNQADKLMDEYHLNIINEMIDLNVDEFKNKISQFINFSKTKINNIKSLNDICNKIKEKLLINYNIFIEKQNININEYNILKEYDEKLDYLLSIQNEIIKNLKSVNEELKFNLNSFKNENNQKKEEINNEELNENINNVNKNIKNLENELGRHFNKCDICNLNNININDFNEKTNFFDVMQNIYSPLKEINRAFEQLLVESSQLNENSNENI